MLSASLPTILEALAASLPVWLLWLGACAGHAYLWIVALNVLYAWPWPHWVHRFTRKIDLTVVGSGPLLFAYALDIFASGSLRWEAGDGRSFLAPYTVCCWLLGFVVFPVMQTFYLCRRQARQLLAHDTRTIDVARELGKPPVGRGKYRSLARLPGNQVFQVDFTQRVFVLPNLPQAWDGLSILHLTDLHLCGTPDRAFYQYVMDRCLDDGVPDIVAFTGDLVDSKLHHRWIVPVLGRLQWNLAGFAILGNHDAWRDTQRIRGRLRKVRFKVLGNTWVTLDVRGTPMVVIGHEGPWFTPPPDLSTCPAGVFRLCLSHTPDNIVWARRHHIDLMLAGHVHGGQIRLPLFGSLFCPSRYSRRYDCGSFFEAPTLMYVGRGLAGQHPLRYNCRPEVTRIVLRKE